MQGALLGAKLQVFMPPATRYGFQLDEERDSLGAERRPALFNCSKLYGHGVPCC